jgi:hypothetical protein
LINCSALGDPFDIVPPYPIMHEDRRDAGSYPSPARPVTRRHVGQTDDRDGIVNGQTPSSQGSRAEL